MIGLLSPGRAVEFRAWNLSRSRREREDEILRLSRVCEVFFN